MMVWNCGRWRNKQAEMNNRLREEGIDVCIISETKTNKNDIIELNGYDFVVKNGDWGKGREGGVMIDIKKGIMWERVIDKQIGKGNKEIERIGIRIKGKNKDINLIGIYRRPGKKLTMKEWRNMEKMVNSKEHWIIAGDFNVHNILWNYRNMDRNRILNYMRQ